MTRVEAVIRQEKLESVVERLLLVGIHGLTVSEVRGFGRSGGKGAIFRGSAYTVSFVPKVHVLWYGQDDDADKVIRAIERASQTGQIGDGKIFVSSIEEAIRVSTGERGDRALV